MYQARGNIIGWCSYTILWDKILEAWKNNHRLGNMLQAGQISYPILRGNILGCDEILDKDEIPKYAFYVKDNGVGIAKEHQKDIFHIFKRLDNSANLVQGSGMGLNFAVRIVERHGGKIWVESELGKGSIFYFTLN